MTRYKDSGRRFNIGSNSILIPFGGSNDVRIKIDLNKEQKESLLKRNLDYLCEFLHQMADEVGIELNKVYVESNHGKKSGGIVDYEGKPYRYSFKARLESHYKIKDDIVEIFYDKVNRVALKARIGTFKNMTNNESNVVIGMLEVNKIDLENYDYENTFNSLNTLVKYKL
jgi:hypothetical protein